MGYRERKKDREQDAGIETMRTTENDTDMKNKKKQGQRGEVINIRVRKQQKDQRE